MSTTANRWRERPPERLEQRIVIERDGTITVRSGKVEYGQGIRTGFAKVIAGELGLPIEKVRVELGETDRVPWDMGTFGSMSTANDGKILRAAAILARKLLLERAAQRLAVAPSELSIAGGRVRAPDGRSVGYQELTDAEPLTGIIPESETSNYSAPPAIDSPLRLEALAIVTGKARYPGDVRLPNMLRGQVLHAPVSGGRLVDVDDHVAREMPGVVTIVRDGDFIGVVAEREQQAIAAIRALRVQWEKPAAPAKPIDAVLRRDSDVEASLAAAPRRFAAEYHVPHISHTPIGPSAAVADVREDGADVYVAAQRPFGLRDDIAQLLSLSPEKIHVHPQMMSGTYGRGNMGDAAIDAVRLSQAVKRPVLVQWTRDEEFRSSPHRPTLDAEITAALNTDGTIAAWRYRTRTNPHTYGGAGVSLPPGVLEMTSGRNAIPPYRLGRAEVLLRVQPAAVRTGAYRSLAAAPNVFAIESFMDELAHGSGQDPGAFRLRHIEDERLRRVVAAVRERSRWDERPRTSGRGLGLACAVYHGTYIAEVAEITADAAGQIRVERVWCAVDAGRLVHPDGARNQIEGGIQQAASWTLFEELRIHDGEVTTASFQDYRIATFHDAIRKIDVSFVPAQEFPSTGTGETGSVPLAAAIANAVFEACGARVRRLPLTPEAIAGVRR